MRGEAELRIYMDACCFNRPMDDQHQDRIRIETDAIRTILQKCKYGLWILVGSDVLEYELNANPIYKKMEKSFSLYLLANERGRMSDEVRNRAKEFEKMRLTAFDSLHLAMAESLDVDVLLSVDDDVIKMSAQTNAKVTVMNPVNWLMEV
jgi:predicted nucleic acid-binding protein